MENEHSFQSATGLGPIHVREYPVDKPLGIVQVVHGMLEHFGRYDRFARRLNNQGYMVIGMDMAGHGLSTPDAPRGYFGARDGWRGLVEDVHALRQAVQKRYPGVPYYIFSHSMGSVITQLYCTLYGKGLSGVLLMGCSSPRLATAVSAKPLTRLFPKKRPSMMFRAMTFAGYNKTYPKPCDVFAWISGDEEMVNSYKTDPLNIETFTARGYLDLSCLAQKTARKSWANEVPKDLPVLFLTGSDDPVGGYGKGVAVIADRLKSAGVRDVNVLVYENCRHELINDCQSDTVYSDIGNWLQGHLIHGQG